VRLPAVIIAPLCAVLLAACGGSGGIPPPKPVAEVSSTPGQASTAIGASGRGASLRIGQSASFAGDQIVGSGKGEQVSLTVQRVVDEGTRGIHYLGARAPALPRGQRRIAVELTFRSTGKAAYNDSPEEELSLIGPGSVAAVGKVLPGVTGPGQCVSDLSTSVDVPPGRIDPGCVFFQVRSDQKISAVRYQTQAGHYLASWAVR
jgi:hypothetical protein